MKKLKYNYLRAYIHNPKDSPSQNWFAEVKEEDIKEAESFLGYKFPVSLKEFWHNIGYGFFRASQTGINTIAHTNRLMTPSQIADIILLKEESGLILYDAPMVEDAMPFFEIGDCYDFLVFLPKSNNPEAIYDQYGYFIEKDLDTFIYNLYYKSPIYYLDVIKNTAIRGIST